jgi:Predicted ATPase involved in replication control, Cdc46/Mcm family
MAMYFQDNEIEAGWEEIFDRKEYVLKRKEIADTYPEKRSLFVSYNDIDAYSTDLAMFILDHPDKSISIGRKVIKDMMPPGWDPTFSVNLRITDLPRDARVEIRQLRAKHLGKFVAVEGLVRKATTVKPRMTHALFRCARCSTEMWEEQTGVSLREPMMCSNMEGSCNKTATRFILDDTRSIYIDTQKVEIQENPEGLRGGAQPERLSGFLEDDISGIITPGNRLILNGVIRSLPKNDRDRSTIFEIQMDVVSIEFEQHEYDEIQITEEDEVEMLRMSKDPDLFHNIIHSISPTIYGLETEKEAIALQLFGGSHKEMDDGTVIRGDMHILLVGDPGVAKSQLLRYMGMLAPRGIYASGKSASAAGLCVHGDTILNLESGDTRIEDLVRKYMTEPEEYRPGIWRQSIEGEQTISMAKEGMFRVLPVTYVWKIKTPEKLVEITTVNDDKLILTPETKIMAFAGSVFDWVEAREIKEGGMVATCFDSPRRMKFKAVRSVRYLTQDLPEFVYDLTVDPAHSFLGNGFVVHNTAAAVKDDFGDGRWTLEAGALVLADKGLACVDELDKMSPQDRSSLHEAMESQKISVAKAGISATLQCRCSMLAAANPKHGRFEGSAERANQIDLPPALLSRFDMIFVLTDEPEATRDKNITQHILKAHRRGQVRRKENKGKDNDSERILSETSDIKPIYEIDVLRKYVAYSKRIVPVLSDEATAKIQDSYLETRGRGGKNSPVPITARQLEAYVRLSEASARTRLSPIVEVQDAERAIRLVKYYLDKIIGTTDGVWDIDTITSGTSKKTRDLMPLILEIFAEHGSGGLMMDEIIQHALDAGITEGDARDTVEKMRSANDLFCPSFGLYKRVDSE